VISSGPGTLYIACDLDITCDPAHHNVIIAWPDRPLGIQTGLKTMHMLAAQPQRTLVYHRPWPGLGHFVKRGFHFEPEPIKFA
jgi:hypothetical protein